MQRSPVDKIFAAIGQDRTGRTRGDQGARGGVRVCGSVSLVEWCCSSETRSGSEGRAAVKVRIRVGVILRSTEGFHHEVLDWTVVCWSYATLPCSALRAGAKSSKDTTARAPGLPTATATTPHHSPVTSQHRHSPLSPAASPRFSLTKPRHELVVYFSCYIIPPHTPACKAKDESLLIRSAFPTGSSRSSIQYFY